MRGALMPARAAICALAAIAFFSFARAPVAAASPWRSLADPVFVRIDTHELPSSAINAIAQDATGFMWIATQDGVGRFDGYHFKSFSPNPSDADALPDGDVLAMVPDGTSGLWLGTKSSGLVRLDLATETFRTWRADPSLRKGPSSASVNALAPAPAGVWVGGDGGLNLFDERTGTFENAHLPADGGREPLVWAILVDSKGTVWAGTQHGLYYRDAGQPSFSILRLGAGDGTPVVWSLCEDRDGNVWAGSDNALFSIGPARRVTAYASSPTDSATLSPGSQFAIVEIRPGTIWIGTNEGGISILDRATRSIRRVAPDPSNPGGLSPGEAWQFFRDRSGLIWIAKNAGGLLLYNPLHRGFSALSTSRPELGISDQGAGSLMESAGSLWTGGSHGALARLDPRSATVTRWTVPNRAFVDGLFSGNDGMLWIPTARGMCGRQGDRAGIDCPAGPKVLWGINAWQGFYDGSAVWVGTREGLVQLRNDGKTTVYRSGTAPDTLSNDEVRAVYRDRRGYVWAGTADGLDRLDPRTGRIRRFVNDPHDPLTIGPGLIWTLLEDSRGRIWAGTVGGPLDVLEIDGHDDVSVRRLGRSDGLPDENVYGLAEDKQGRIWASTENGIAVVDPVTLKARGLGYVDGVLEGAYWGGSVSRAPDGTIAFGGVNGITVIDPGAQSPWTYSPPLVVSALRVAQKSLPVASANHGDSVDLPAGSHTISVEFAALDFSGPNAIRYAYKLDGFDREWTEADTLHRTATYTNLAPGSYTLRVRGTNRLGVWSRRELALRVVAVPAWYETWWFRVLLALLAVAAVYGATQWRTSVLRRRQRVLEGIIAERTRELSVANQALSIANGALSSANKALERASLTDPLTGLRNRRFLTIHIEDDVALCVRRYNDWIHAGAAPAEAPNDADLVFFLLDIDHFKSVNDELGHAAGDRVLAQMRGRLEEVFRESDYVLRWGGEEFLAVARGSRRSDAPEMAERLREAVERRPFDLDGGQTLVKTASIGYAAFPFVPNAPRALGWEQLVELADQALYAAKRSGRNTWFGLAASDRTDPAHVAELLAHGGEDVAVAGKLEILTRRAGVRVRPRS